MKVKGHVGSIRCKDIESGELFSYERQVFLKTQTVREIEGSPGDFEAMVVDIHDGCVGYVSLNAIVMPLHGYIQLR